MNFEIRIEISLNDMFSYVLGTDFWRTINTAATVVAGMFPPKPDDMFHPDIKWYSIASIKQFQF